MANNINVNQRLGEIVSIFPGSAEIFQKYKIDYCCGGHDSLKEALDEKVLAHENIVKELNDEYEKFKSSNGNYKDWRNEDPIVLMKHIQHVHHDYTYKALSEIDPLMRKILKVHFKHNSEELLKVHKLFGTLKIELEEHLIKEEENLFPLIEQYEKAKDEETLKAIRKFIKETEDEHDTAGDIFKELEEITRDFKAPEGACTTFQLVYTKIDALEKDIFTHIYLENSVLFNMYMDR
ncbi:iron-sulfur cluster repair di-iron protein [Clostridium sp. BSD9I1]|uniref:iron-sulfur cluster repair di-iron protein n=1 Tax=Clostridium sp. BSD9I1 TaxID=2003589 RepID=UPI00164465A5|nr:iron-sulfur cluster repair di-iron protein [Clostridium sp. BSD9I1]